MITRAMTQAIATKKAQAIATKANKAQATAAKKAQAIATKANKAQATTATKSEQKNMREAAMILLTLRRHDMA